MSTAPPAPTIDDAPDYDELPILGALGLPCAWDALPHNLGTLVWQTPERIAAAAGLVRDGRVVSLNLPVTEPDPPLFGREPLRHTLSMLDRQNADDRLDAFYPQGSSQWDGLRHVRAREFGYFGGHTEDFESAEGPLGVEHFADHGVVGRGVLLDLAGFRERAGDPLDPFAPEAIEADALAEAASAQGVEIRPGDVLCIRTGWIEAYRRLPLPRRLELVGNLRVSGLSGSDAVARYLWNNRVSAVALDNPTAEVAPGSAAIGSLHRRLIPMLGFVVGELLDFERLAGLCTADGRWEFMFTAAPMNLPGGVGSPANALAIR